ncbi:MAG: hypothetical protein ACXWLI_08660, partial [Myxococcaceae bacterium]
AKGVSSLRPAGPAELIGPGASEGVAEPTTVLAPRQSGQFLFNTAGRSGTIRRAMTQLAVTLEGQHETG